MKLVVWIGKTLGCGTRRARARILSGEVQVDGTVTRDPGTVVTRFHRVTCGDEECQPGMDRIHLMLHKPAGVLSATRDPLHRTVLDLIDRNDLPEKGDLHLAGRLDRSSTGLVLLTNDGAWSEALTRPEAKAEKVYLVETDRPIPPVAVDRFAEGFYFATEDLVTRPARLEILGERRARVTLCEGRYHQIKRMFHRVDSLRLVSLHRIAIGPYHLPGDLAPGQWRRIDGID